MDTGKIVIVVVDDDNADDDSAFGSLKWMGNKTIVTQKNAD